AMTTDQRQDHRSLLARNAAPPRLDFPSSETPLFGRDAELVRLQQLLEEAIRGHGHTVTVAGEAGIGKTRLLSALAVEALQRGCRVLVGRCHASDSILPFGPWVDACRRGGIGVDKEILGALSPPWRAGANPVLTAADAGGRPSPRASRPHLLA